MAVFHAMNGYRSPVNQLDDDDRFRLRNRRKSRHWTQRRLAKMADVSQQLISAYERGSCRIPNDILKRLIHALEAE